MHVTTREPMIVQLVTRKAFVILEDDQIPMLCQHR